MIQTKNDYELGVMNGAMGIVLGAETDGGLTVDFDGMPVEIEAGSDALGNLQLAYATSIHKVQGSEFPCAVVIAHKSHSFMHHRNLLYTAVTRAKESVIILGRPLGDRQLRRQTPGGPAQHVPVFPAAPESPS